MYLPIIIFLFFQKTYEIMNQILMRIKKNCVPVHVHSAHIATAAHHHICCPCMLMSQCLHIRSFSPLFSTESLGIVYCEPVHLSILFTNFFIAAVSLSRDTLACFLKYAVLEHVQLTRHYTVRKAIVLYLLLTFRKLHPANLRYL